MPVRLFVGNLPYSATEEELRQHLSTVATPVQIVLPVDRETGRPRGFAFVDIADRALAEEAIRRFDSQDFKGRRLAVSEARAREDRPPGPRPSWSGSAPGIPRTPRPPGDRSARSPLPDQAPQRRRTEPRRDRKDKAERGPKGPIRERTTGRFYALEDDPGTDLPEFDNFATSPPEGQPESADGARADDDLNRDDDDLDRDDDQDGRDG